MKWRQAATIRADGGRQAYRIAWLWLAIGLIGAVAVLYATGMTIDYRVLFLYDGVIALLFAMHIVYSRFRPMPTLGRATGSMALMISSALLAGIIANAGMRLRFPLIDPLLAAGDRAIGIDTPAVILAIAERPLFVQLLSTAYESIFPITFLTAIGLAILGKTQRLWELTTGFGGGIVITAITSVFVPAIGVFPYSGLEYLSGQSLPTGAGTYYLHAVATYRDGVTPLLDLHKLEGVVTFPSFHMVMAIITAYAFRSIGIFSWLIYGWCALVAVSTIPIGGHYAIDLVGGMVVWALLHQTFTARSAKPHECSDATPTIANR